MRSARGPRRAPRFFAWTVAPGLSAAFLGAFYFTALVLAAGSAMQEGAAWLWTLIYVAVPIAVAFALVQQLRAPGIDRPRMRPLPSW